MVNLGHRLDTNVFKLINYFGTNVPSDSALESSLTIISIIETFGLQFYCSSICISEIIIWFRILLTKHCR